MKNITPDHFALSDGRPALEVDADGFPRVSREVTDPVEVGLANVALALYSCGPHEASTRAQIYEWLCQYGCTTDQIAWLTESSGYKRSPKSMGERLKFWLQDAWHALAYSDDVDFLLNFGRSALSSLVIFAVVTGVILVFMCVAHYPW